MMVNSVRDIAAAVRGRRKERGLSQGELAIRSGVSRKWVSEFEAGKPSAELGLVMRVLDTLGIRIDLGSIDTPAGDTGGESQAVDLDVLLDEHRMRR